MEHRDLQRIPVRFPISFSGDLIDGEGEVYNLTSSGCGVRSGLHVHDRSYVHLFLHLPQLPNPMKVELAAIRWTNEKNFGLEFIRINQKQQKLLRVFLLVLGRDRVH